MRSLLYSVHLTIPAVVVLFLAAAAPSLGQETGRAAGEEVLTLSDLFALCHDLEKLPVPEPGVTCRQFSSYDRSGPRANRDWNNFLRSSEEEGNVCAEMEGPGCILRIWSANPSGRLFFYLDGEPEPALEMAMGDLFTGEHYPFVDPLAYMIRGADAYVPIPYRTSCKIVLKENQPLYYHFGYKTYPRDTVIETYSPSLAEAAAPQVRKTVEILKNLGPELVKRIYPEGLEEIELEATVQPGESGELFIREGAGRIALLMLKGASTERHFLRKTLLRIFWDDEPAPAVNCPLGDFFGTSFGENPYRALPMGMTGEGGYCLFPMPFDQGARIELLNEGKQPVKVTGLLMHGPLPGEGPYHRFHAGWRRENPNRTFDYPVLQARGQGKFVGCALYIDNPRARWWGEGDEKIYVDGESFPSIHGTGPEDYFGDAWGHRHHVRPFEGCTLCQNPRFGNKTCVYRFHVSDSIPFARSFKMTMENYAKDVDYTSVAWWYQAPGGNDFFKKAPVASRIPGKPIAIGALEAENLNTWPVNGKIFEIDDGNLPEELSKGRGILLKGNGPFAFNVPVAEDGNYHLYVGFAHGLKHPPVEVFAPDDVPMLPVPLDGGKPDLLDRRKVATVRLKADGSSTIYLRVVNPVDDDVRMILDFIATEPVTKTKDALEAENLAILAQEGGRAAIDHVSLPWSNGSQLRFTAREEGANMDLALPIKADGVYSITGVCTRLVGYGPFTLTIDEQRVGTVDPTSLTGDALGAFTVGPVELNRGDHKLTIVTDTAVGLDTFMLTWSLARGNVFEGESLEVLDFSLGMHEVQSLDKRVFSRGAHRWFKGEREGAFIEVALPVESDGEYRLKIFFCRSHDYGTVKVFLNGTPAGEPFDGYNPRVEPSGPVDFGLVRLKQGKVRLRFMLAGKNERSTGYYMGVDGVMLE